MAIKKEPGKGLISKIRSNRVANANNITTLSKRKSSGSYHSSSPTEGSKVGFSKETAYKEKNALGKPVMKERKVTPTANGFTVRNLKKTTGKDGVSAKVKFKEKTYDASGKLVARSRNKYQKDASGNVQKKGVGSTNKALGIKRP